MLDGLDCVDEDVTLWLRFTVGSLVGLQGIDQSVGPAGAAPRVNRIRLVDALATITEPYAGKRTKRWSPTSVPTRRTVWLTPPPSVADLKRRQVAGDTKRAWPADVNAR